MDLVLRRAVSTSPVALTGITGLPVALYLFEVKVRQILNAGVEVAADVVFFVSGNPLCKL